MEVIAIVLYSMTVIIAIVFALIYRSWLKKNGNRDVPSMYQSDNGISIKDGFHYFKIVNKQ